MSSGRRRTPVIDRSRAAVLDAATRVLVESPQLSLGELAGAIGISRATLHRMFPTRRDLLVALAHDAIDQLEARYRESGLGAPSDDPMATITRLIGLLIPLGPRLLFVLRATELDDEEELDRRAAELDRPLEAVVEQALQAGYLDPALPVWWIVQILYAAVYTGWEQVTLGRLAARDAAALVLRTWLHGVQQVPVQ